MTKDIYCQGNIGWVDEMFINIFDNSMEMRRRGNMTGDFIDEEDDDEAAQKIESPTQVSRGGFLDWVEELQDDLEDMFG